MIPAHLVDNRLVRLAQEPGSFTNGLCTRAFRDRPGEQSFYALDGLVDPARAVDTQGGNVVFLRFARDDVTEQRVESPCGSGQTGERSLLKVLRW